MFYGSLKNTNPFVPSLCRLISTKFEREVAIKEFVYRPAICDSTSTLAPILEASRKKGIEYVVVMFGWLCAPFRPLGKYVELNNRFGMDTLVHQPRARSLLYPYSGYRLVRKRITELQEFTEMKEKETGRSVRYLFHVLSNQGCFHHAMFFDELKKQNLTSLQKRFRGSIVDSAPSKITESIFARAFTAGFFAWERATLSKFSIFNSPQVSRLIGTQQHDAVYDHRLVTPGFKAYMRLVRLVYPGLSAYLSSIEKAVENIPVDFPHLYIYSRNDPLIPGDEVESYIQRQIRERKAKFESCVFDDVAHVANYRLHPEEYKAAMQRFWEKCISQDLNR